MARPPELAITPGQVNVDPGGRAQITATVTNRDDRHRRLSITVLGVDPSWVTIEPSAVDLAPGDNAQASIQVQVPSGANPPRVVGVRAWDPGDESVSRVEEVAVTGGAQVPASPPADSKGGIRLRLEEDRLGVRPGATARVDLHVFNGTEVVDEFEVEAVGFEPGWLTASPPRLSLFPGKEGVTTLTIAVPGDARLPAGSRRIGVKVTSVAHPQVSRVEELELEVGALAAAELVVEPQTISARKRGRGTVQLVNRGNQPLAANLRGSDPEQAITFEFTPARLEVPPFGTGVSTITLSGKRPFVGQPVRRPFTVRAEGGGEPLEAQGTLTQRARIPAGLARVLTMVLGVGLLVGAAALVWALVGPEPEPPSDPPSIVAFGPDGPLSEDGCVTLAWEVTNAEVVRLVTPQEGTAQVDPMGSRQVCGSQGDEALLEAESATGEIVSASPYVFSLDLAMGEVQTSVIGRTAVFDVTTNRAADVTVTLVGRGAEATSSGRQAHHLELTDQPSGEVQWRAVASASGEDDQVQEGTLVIPYYYARVTVVEGPELQTDPTTTTSAPGTTLGGGDSPFVTFTIPSDLIIELPTLVVGYWYAYANQPVQAFLTDECPEAYAGTLDSELILPLADDGSLEVALAVDWCDTTLEENATEPIPAEAASSQVIELSSGFEPESEEVELVFPTSSGQISMTVLVERLRSETEPDFDR